MRWRRAAAVILGGLALFLGVWLFVQTVYCPRRFVSTVALGGPARERRAIEICKEHLRVIYKALMQYKEEWGDFPHNLDQLSRYLPSKDVLYCPNVPEEYKKIYPSSYGWLVFWKGEPKGYTPRNEIEKEAWEMERKSGVHSFEDVVRVRGEEAPLVICDHHWERRPVRNKPINPRTYELTFVVLRLNGKVEVVKKRLIDRKFNWEL